MMLAKSAKWLLAAVAIGLIGTFATLLTRPEVAANPPAEALFEVQPSEAPLMALESLDFVFRPLFTPERRAPADIETVVMTPEPSQQAALEGVTLIGVFASGDSQGVIVRRDNGEQLRVVEGSEIDGWQLSRVESRAAVFAIGTGDAAIEDRIEMGIVSSLSVPQAVPGRRATGVGGVGADSDDSDAAAQAASGAAPEGEAPAPPTLTFDDIYRQRADAMQRQRENNSPK